MTKAEIVAKIAEAAEVSKSTALTMVEAYEGAIINALKEGDTYRINNLGTFKPTVRAARTGRNPQTGATINIPEKKTIKFSVSKTYGTN